MIALTSLIAFIFLWGYYIFFELAWNGQTPGKRWTKLRVLRTDGTPIGPTEVIIRNLLRLIDFLPFWYGIGIVSMFIQKESRRLGDLAAGTLVVLENQREITLESLDQPRAAVYEFRPTLEGVGPLPIEKLEPADFERIEDFLRRRYQMTTRRQVATRLVLSLLEKMGLPNSGPVSLDAERVLESIQRGARH